MERTNRAMETKKMKLLETEVLCPYCMKKFKLGQVHFRTSKCFTLDEIREQNVKLSEMESDGIVAPAELEKEKKILNDLIEVNKKLINSKFLYVTKLNTTNNYSKCYLYLTFEKNTMCSTVTFYSDTIFSKMEFNKEYSLEDLGLC